MRGGVRGNVEGNEGGYGRGVVVRKGFGGTRERIVPSLFGISPSIQQ